MFICKKFNLYLLLCLLSVCNVHQLLAETISPQWQRTIIFIQAPTDDGQEISILGGLSNEYSLHSRGTPCGQTQWDCAIPIRHNNNLNDINFSQDLYLDWASFETGQNGTVFGSPAIWTTNNWPSSWGEIKTVAQDGYGEHPLNIWGEHYWMLDVQMDCSKTGNGWFEFKAFKSNGEEWENDIYQSNSPYVNKNHFAQCGKTNLFKFNQSDAKFYSLNQSPEIISPALQTGRQGELYQYQVIAEDSDSDNLTYYLKQAPTGMQIDPQTGQISWIPNNHYYNQSITQLNICEFNENQITQSITYSDFSDLSAITLNGSASYLNPADNNVLRLTDNLWQGGSAFVSQPITLSDSSGFKASFSSAFSFQITQPQGMSDSDGQGADGFVFVVQTQDDEVGAVGGGLGYEGIKPSIGIEFDTWDNLAKDSYNGNHIGLNINGSIVSSIQIPLATRLNDASPWFVWVDYNGVDQLLEVRLATENIRPEQTVLSYSLDLASILQSEEAYVGFTSATGDAANIHDILSWQFINTFAPIGDLPDLVPYDLQLLETDGLYQFKAQVINRGKALINNTFHSSFFNDDPTVNGNFLASSMINDLAMGESTTITWPVSDIKQLTDDIYLWTDNQKKVIECNEHNNISRSALVWVNVNDNDGGEDQQLFVISVKAENHPPRITSQPINNATLAKPYVYQVTAKDADLGDILTYSLTDAPAGMNIDGNSGEINWTTMMMGEVSVTVSVTDLAGETDNQTYLITVHMVDNLAPEFVSSPVKQASENSAYHYASLAVDPNPFDSLTYSLQQGPDGMSIDPATGEINWMPTAAYINGVTEQNKQCYLKQEGNVIRSIGDAEVLVVIDVSGSMGGETRWVGGMALALEEKLKEAGVGTNGTNKYGLVNYSSYGPRNTLLNGNKFGSAQEFDTASASLYLYGGTEDGWQAVNFALNDYPKAEKAARNIILVTDEDRDNRDSSITYASILQELDGQSALLNSVVNARFKCEDGTSALGMNSNRVGYVADGNGGYSLCENAYAYSGSGNTIAHYVEMAMENGGAAWDLNYLRSGGHYAQSFSKALIDIKVNEIIEQLPPAMAADLMVHNLSLVKADDGYHLQLQLQNRGLADVETETEVVIYSGSPEENSLEIARFSIPSLSIGQQELLDTLVDESLLEHDLYTEILVNEQLNECELENNNTHSAVIKLKTADRGGLYDTQLYSISTDDSNSAPKITSQANPIARVNEAYLYFVTATDSDIGDGLTFSLIEDIDLGYSIPEGMQIDDFTGAITWIATTEQQAQSFVIAVKVTDLRGAEDIQLFTIEVSAEAIRLFGPGLQENYSGDTVELQLIVNHAPEVALGYQATGLPAGLSINSDGLITGNTDITGEFQVSITVTDLTHETSSNISFTWLITDEVNVAPVITSTPEQQAQINTLWQYQITATDENGDNLDFTLFTAPQGLMLQDKGLLEWTPNATQMGQHSIEVQVTDGALTQNQRFVLTVPQTDLDNYPPQISSQPTTAIIADQLYQYQLLLNDPDGDELTVTIDKAPSGLSIDNNKLLTWQPTATQLGNHPIEISVSDGHYISKQSFTLTVLLASEENNAPQITSQPAGLAIVDKEYLYQVSASDSDNDILYISLLQAPAGMMMDVQNKISWTAASDDIGLHNIVIQITDGKVLLTQSYTLTVAEAGSVNHAPSFTSLPDADHNSVAIGREFSFDINASDPDGDQLTFSLEVQGDNLINLEINSETGLLSASPFADDQIASYHYKVTVTDNSGASSWFEYQLQVLAEGSNNHAPYFISQPVTLLKVDETYHYPLQAADADGDMISYTLLSGLLNLDADGLLSWQPTIDDLGQYQIKVEASDRYGATALQQFTLYLLEAGNNAPVIISEANTQLRLEQGPYYYQVQAIDADGQAVTFQLLDAPQGMTIDSLSGKIDWQAEQTQLGSHNIQIRATDSDGQSSEQSYQLQVTNTGPWNRRLCR